MVTQPAEVWRTVLRASLLAARKKRDPTRVTALRSVLSAIDNAETPDTVVVTGRTNGAVAGAVAGVGSTEVARRDLSDEQIRALVRSEIDERLSAADQFIAGGHFARAEAMHAEVAILSDLLGDV
ncbi:MAG: uncharacterized protein QOJ24_3229 [Mycobacterium sp.]|jgi:uncharacterized protein YqeY|nr:uncharacterized protein [Mycobacterium sp.]